MERKQTRICVFCGSSPYLDQKYYELGYELGGMLGEHGYGLVFGAGTIGLMGAVARGVHRSGGTVTGVIPHALDRSGVTYEECDELIRTETMRQRKAIMEQNAAAFIALPGGIGTLEEILEIITLKQLHYHTKPIVLLNGFGYFDPLLAQLHRAVDEQFSDGSLLALFEVAVSAHEALHIVRRELGEPVSEQEREAPSAAAIEDAPSNEVLTQLE